MHILTVASSKGGVGKTSVAVHLATGFASEGQRVLLVDLDPGAHATTWMLGDRAPRPGIAEAMVAGHLGAEQVHAVEDRPRLFVSAGGPPLDQVEAQLAAQFGRERILRELLRESRRPQFDTVVIDCPPTTGFLAQSAVFAADAVLSPVLPGFLGLAGVIDIRLLVEQVRRRGRGRAELLGTVIFGGDPRESLTEETRESLRQMTGGRPFDAEVRVSTAGKRLPSLRATAWDAGLDPRGHTDYTAILNETKQRLAGRGQKGA